MSKTADKLRQMAADIEAAEKADVMPNIIGATTVAAAAKALRSCLGKDAYFSIRLEASFGLSTGTTGETSIYDGEKFIAAPTLEMALALTLAAHSPATDPATDMDAAFQPADLADTDCRR